MITACNHLPFFKIFPNFVDFWIFAQIFKYFALFALAFTCVTLLSRIDHVYILIGIHSLQDWAATTRHGVTRKRSTEEFCREFQSQALRGKKLLSTALQNLEKVTETSCNLSESWVNHRNKEVGLVEPVRMNIYQNSTYRKDLSWLNFEMS